MDDIERAVDDGVNTFKALTRDDRFVPGAGATEIELAKQISSFGEVRWVTGLDIYLSVSLSFWIQSRWGLVIIYVKRLTFLHTLFLCYKERF